MIKQPSSNKCDVNRNRRCAPCSDGAEAELGSAQAASVPALHGDAEAAPQVERRAAIARVAGHGLPQAVNYVNKIFT